SSSSRSLPYREPCAGGSLAGRGPHGLRGAHRPADTNRNTDAPPHADARPNAAGHGGPSSSATRPAYGGGDPSSGRVFRVRLCPRTGDHYGDGLWPRRTAVRADRGRLGRGGAVAGRGAPDAAIRLAHGTRDGL